MLTVLEQIYAARPHYPQDCSLHLVASLSHLHPEGHIAFHVIQSLKQQGMRRALRTACGIQSLLKWSQDKSLGTVKW